MNVKNNEELFIKIEKAKEQLALLKKQQSDLEREKSTLEDMKTKQEQWATGRKEVDGDLSKAITILETEESDLQRMCELVGSAGQRFSELLEDLRGVKEELWTPDTLQEDLDRALLLVHKGRSELARAKARIPALDEKFDMEVPPARQPVESVAGRVKGMTISELIRIGFWISLPFVVMVIIVILALALI